jgi:hypothetical protein
MSYDLNLHFDPAIDANDFQEYFARRRHFTAGAGQITYQNPDTGVGFFIHYQPGKVSLFRRKIGDARVEINYFRPSYFGIEAEIELSALVAALAPKIDDPQIKGMGQGPYSREGFLRGWNFGNEFAVRALIAGHPDRRTQTMPASKLHAAWTWNYRKPEWLVKANDLQFVPSVTVLAVQNTPSLVAIWALGMPILLPKVDYVLVGRDDSGVKRFGLAPWSEVLAQLQRAGIDVESDPLDVRYSVTPVSIARWVADRPEVDLKTLPRLSLNEVIDSEIVEAATQPRA